MPFWLRRAFPGLLLGIAVWGVPHAQAQTCAVLFSSAQAMTTSGTGPESLYATTVPANTLDADGEYLEISWSAKHAANSNPQSHGVFYGSSVVGSVTTTVGSNIVYLGELRLFYVDAGTQLGTYEIHRGANLVATGLSHISEDPTLPLLLSLEATTPTQAGDVTFDHFTVLVCQS
jgi:hypothetical protein